MLPVVGVQPSSRPAGTRSMLDVKFNPSSNAALVGGVHLSDVKTGTADQYLCMTYPRSLTVDPLSSINKGGGVSALSNSWGWQLTAPLPLIKRLSLQKRSRPDATSAARYSEKVKWSQSESRAN